MKITFSIRARYITGNSFGSQETTDTVGHVFESAEDAVDAIDRIWDHKKCYDSHNNWRNDEPRMDPRGERWFLKGDDRGDWQYTVVLKGGDQIGTFWLGYFEELQDLTIGIDR